REKGHDGIDVRVELVIQRLQLHRPSAAERRFRAAANNKSRAPALVRPCRASRAKCWRRSPSEITKTGDCVDKAIGHPSERHTAGYIKQGRIYREANPPAGRGKRIDPFVVFKR